MADEPAATGDGGAVTIALRGGTQPIAILLAIAVAATLAYTTLATDLTQRLDNTASRVESGVAAVFLVCLAGWFLWRWAHPRRWTWVIDADGVREGSSGRSLRWTDLHHVAYRGSAIELFPHPEAGGRAISIDLANTDADPIEAMDAIRRFAHAAGSDVEVPELVRTLSARAVWRP